ncbi:hypothetical protein [Ensifer aridi]|nr:hypothetical protein [Ensifer aridi]
MSPKSVQRFRDYDAHDGKKLKRVVHIRSGATRLRRLAGNRGV